MLPNLHDKGSGMVVKGKSQHIRLLSSASIDDVTKFERVDDKRPNLRGRPPKHFHPLLQKEKDVHSILHQILPEDIATSLSPTSLRLAHLYWLPKTHKAKLSMTPILSATGTCNFNLAKWLEEKLKPLSVNEYTITDAFEFADEIRSIPINDEDVLVSYDVTALFTDVPLSEAINILADKAFIPTTGLIKPMILILKLRNLHSSLKLPLPISFFSSMVICMRRLTV